MKFKELQEVVYRDKYDTYFGIIALYDAEKKVYELDILKDNGKRFRKPAKEYHLQDRREFMDALRTRRTQTLVENLTLEQIDKLITIVDNSIENK
jgi:hypothetical protein